jgi:hypothetical protein
MKLQKRLVLALLLGGSASVMFYWLGRSDNRNDDLLTRHKEAIILKSSPTPLTDNPWYKYHGPSTLSFPGGGAVVQTEGLVADMDAHSKPMRGTGTYPWSPGPLTLDQQKASGLFLSGKFAKNHLGYKTTQDVPSNIVPYGSIGTVYYHFVKNRTTFSYMHHARSGFFRSDGPAEPYTGQVDRPTGGASFVIWVQPAGAEWPESTDLDLASMRK